MPRPVNARLYKLLEVDPESTSGQIAASFERMSLREQFHQAFHIIGNADRKRLYDMGGERMIDYLLSKAWGPLVSTLGATTCVKLYCAALIGGSIALLIWFVLLALKVDNVAELTWEATFAPLFILLAGNVALHVAALYAAIRTTFDEEDTDGRVLDRAPAVCNVLSAVCYLVFASLVAAAVGENQTYEVPSSNGWMSVFALLIVGDLLSILSSAAWRHPSKVRKSLLFRYRNKPVPPLLTFGFVGLVVLHAVMAVLRWALIGSKLDGSYTGSWYRAFAPIPVRLGFGVIETLLNSIYLRDLGVRTTGEVFFSSFGSLFLNGLVVMAVYMLAANLEGARQLSLASILIPIYVMCAYTVLAAVYTSYKMITQNRMLEEKDHTHRVLNPIGHDPFAPRSAPTAHQSSVPMVGAIPIMMSPSDKPGQAGDMLSETDDEELEEIEVDEEPEHYLDEDDQHSPFEGTDGPPVHQRFVDRYGASTPPNMLPLETGRPQRRGHKGADVASVSTSSIPPSSLRRHHNPYGASPPRNLAMDGPITDYWSGIAQAPAVTQATSRAVSRTSRASSQHSAAPSW